MHAISTGALSHTRLLTPVTGAASASTFFGLSLVGLRLFSVFAQATAIVVTGLMARELGGNRFAQATAAIVVAISPCRFLEGTRVSIHDFDFLWWVLIPWLTIRLLKSDNYAGGCRRTMPRANQICSPRPRLKQISHAFYRRILGGMLLSSARRYFFSAWFWAGVVVALTISCLHFPLAGPPRFHLVSVSPPHLRVTGNGRAEGFLKDQVMLCINGLAPLDRWPVFNRFSIPPYPPGMAIIPVALFYFGKGRGYYTAGVYPMLLAMGAAGCERWLASLPRVARRSIAVVWFAGLAFCGAYIIAVVVPLASSGPLRDFTLKRNGDLREEFGWDELVRTVAGIRDSLPAEQRSSLGITVGNYGEQGAIEMLGPAYRLPPPISTTNSAWLRGYPSPPPTTLIVLGITQEEADSIFTGCRLVAHNRNSLGIRNEESEIHPDIFLCGRPRKPWDVVWKEHHDFTRLALHP